MILNIDYRKISAPALRIFALGGVCLSLVSIQSRGAWASDVDAGQVSEASATRDLEPLNGSPWHLFGGVGGGYGLVTGQPYSSAPHGPDFSAGGDLALETGRWAFDVGAGWIYSSVSGADDLSRPVDVRTRAGFAEFSPRYRLDDHWQLGPVLNVAFGTDTGFGPQVTGAFATPFLGLKAVYERALDEHWELRAFAQVATDLSFGQTQATLGMIGVQIGLPLSGSKTASEEPTLADARTEGTDARSDSGPPETEELRVVLDPQRVFFRSSSAELKPEVKQILAEIGGYLDRHRSEWREVEIAGHADRRGAFQFNMKLSKARAISVRNAMESSTASDPKVKVEAFSYLKPLDPHSNPGAWAKNRRVEIVFHGVRNPAYLKQKIRELTHQHVASSFEWRASQGGQG